MMCKRLVLLQQHVQHVLRDQERVDLELSPTQWKQLSQLTSILEPCAEAVKRMEGERYRTLGMVIPSIVILTNFLTGAFPVNNWAGLDPAVNEVRLDILNQLSLPERFQDFSRGSRFASILDPRFKSLPFLNVPAREECYAELLSHLSARLPSEAAVAPALLLYQPLVKCCANRYK
jgi:hypothetical protein